MVKEEGEGGTTAALRVRDDENEGRLIYFVVRRGFCVTNTNFKHKCVNK